METIPYNSYFHAPDVDPLFPTSVTMPLEKLSKSATGIRRSDLFTVA